MATNPDTTPCALRRLHTRQPFNADLYTVAATVIPVLFVALMLPHGILARYSVWAKRQRTEQIRRITRSAERRMKGRIPAMRLWSVLRIHELLALPVTVFGAFFLFGELSAALALDHRRASQLEHWFVTALILLPVIAFVSASVAISWGWASDLRGSVKGPPASGDD